MKTFIRLFLIALIALTPLFSIPALAENYDDGEDDTKVYTMVDAAGEKIMSYGGRIFAGDEYISEDNQLYRVVSVDVVNCVATAEHLGPEPEEFELSMAVFAPVDATSQSGSGEKKLVGMYSTHSDESYIKGDGTESKKTDAGIFDVGDALKKELEAKGIEVIYSKDTFHPHDAGAYRRSRSTAEELVKQTPAAIFDIHRDGIPDASEYEKTIEDTDITKVRLLVGRSNPSSSANRTFAKQIKKIADEEYPGLIRDIFIGRGNYNQELYPKSVLLEMGTHTSDKEEVIASTKYLADVLEKAVFGGAASAGTEEEQAEDNKSSGVGIAWLIGIAALAAIVYALAATGTFKGMFYKLGRSVNETTGGLVGKKPDDINDRERDE